MPDIDTLRLCSLLATLSFGIVFAVMWRLRRGDDYYLHWSASSFLYGALLVCFDLGHGRSPLLTVFLLGVLGFTDVLLLSGVRRFEGLAPFRWWMGVPVLTAMLGYALPLALTAMGWVTAHSGAFQIGESVGLSLTVGVVGVALIRGEDRDRPVGRAIAGAALIGYVPAYLLAAAGEFGVYHHSNLLPLLPMLADQLLLGVLNLGLLAMPTRRAQAWLREAALRDPLTAAWNRAGLDVQKRRLLATGAAVVAIDVDHFKAINDAHGHAAGDEVLATIAREVGRFARSLGGELGRVGGDEFLVILPEGGDGAAFFAERMRASLPPPGALDPHWTVSLGVASVLDGEDSFAPALKRADACLYRAKAAGRDRVAA